ncbi:hypothetical protein BH10PLA2_BH10PLA2_27940 [soil metagenome]
MNRHSLQTTVRQIRNLVAAQEATGLSDGQLLRAFVAHNDQAAFTALVNRHGSQVFAVGHRLLRNAQDAEDVFQAVFLVLAKKARSLSPRESLAGWLHRTAHSVALGSEHTSMARIKPDLILNRCPT